MRVQFYGNVSGFIHRFFRTIIICVWLIGLVSGIRFAHSGIETSCLLIKNSLSNPTSWIGLFLILFVPLAICSISLFLNIPALCIPVVGGNAFCLGYCALSVMLSFRSGGWLICAMLLFTYSCASAILIWFLMRNAAHRGSREVRADLAICIAVSLAVGLLDFYFICPYVTSLATIL